MGDVYTFGFNGQEKKDDYDVQGGHNHALYWEYDTRVGRRWNMDPVNKVSLSPYSVFADNPIARTDYNGDDTSSLTRTASSIVNHIISPFITVSRSLIGSLFHHGEKTKQVENKDFEPAIAAIIKAAAERCDILLEITDNLKDLSNPPPANVDVKGQTEYLSLHHVRVYFNSGDQGGTGTNPLYEELFHYNDFATGNFQPKGGDVLSEEASAKFQVATNIKNITTSFRMNVNKSIQNPQSKTNYYIYPNTQFGIFKIRKMSAHDIKLYISNPIPSLQEYQLYQNKGGNDVPVEKAKIKTNNSGEGQYKPTGD